MYFFHSNTYIKRWIIHKKMIFNLFHLYCFFFFDVQQKKVFQIIEKPSYIIKPVLRLEFSNFLGKNVLCKPL